MKGPGNVIIIIVSGILLAVSMIKNEVQVHIENNTEYEQWDRYYPPDTAARYCNDNRSAITHNVLNTGPEESPKGPVTGRFIFLNDVVEKKVTPISL